MRAKTITIILLAIGLSVFTWAGQGTPTPQAPPSQGMMHQHNQEGMAHQHMKEGMMSPEEMQAMMQGHHEAMTLVDQLQQGLAQLQQERNMKMARQRLGENLALVEQLRSRIHQHGSMMEQMKNQMKDCPMMQSEQHQQSSR